MDVFPLLLRDESVTLDRIENHYGTELLFQFHCEASLNFHSTLLSRDSPVRPAPRISVFISWLSDAPQTLSNISTAASTLSLT